MSLDTALKTRDVPRLRSVSDVSMRASLDHQPIETEARVKAPTRRHWHLVRWLTLLLLLIAVGVGIDWYLAPPIVAVTYPLRGPAVQAVYATGTVEASVMMPIAARVTGRLVALEADEPAQVTKGQVLARLEDEDLQSSLEQLRAQETFTRQEFLRDEQLLTIGGVARNTYEKAKSDWEAAKAAVARATTEAGYTKIVAPANGRIIRRDGEIGQLIAANQPVFWLAQKSALRVSAEVDEEDIGSVKAGQEVLIRADAFPGQIFHGRVRSITPKGDPVARSYRVRIELSENTPLLIGMTAETNIITARREDVLLVPATAIAGDKLWTVADGKLGQRTVAIGAKGAERVEVMNGIDRNDLIVIKPTTELVDGRTVKTKLPAKARP